MKLIWFIYDNLQVISTVYKQFGCNFLWNCLKFSDKMGLTMQMRTFNNVKIVTQFNLNRRQILDFSIHYRACMER